MNVHSEILNVTIRDLRHANAAINLLETASSNAADIIRKFSLKTLQLEGGIHLLETISFIQISLFHLKLDLTNLKIGLQMLKTYASPLIVPNDIFIDILGTASIRLPCLLFPAETEFLSLYRDISQVYTRHMASKGTLCYYLLLHMREDPSDIFDVFKIDALPYPLDDYYDNYFVQVQPTATYLAVTKNRNVYL